MSKSDRQDKATKTLGIPSNAQARAFLKNAPSNIQRNRASADDLIASVKNIANNNVQEGKTENFDSSQSVSDSANTGTEVVASRGNTQGSIRVAIEPEEPKELTPTLNDMKSKSKNLSRMSEQGIVNEQTGAAVVVRTDGQINLAASKYSSYKLSPKGKVTEQSMESEKITNRMRLLTDEIIINEHKMNPQLWELTDFRESPLLTSMHALIGGFTLDGHVLVKAWEPQLKRYMLIRRPWRGPMFGPILNVPEINSAIRIDDPLKINDDILALTDKGYQVSTVIKDSKSLIGKAGQDRPGIPRNVDAMQVGGGGGSSSSSYSGNVTVSKMGGGNTDPKIVYQFLKKMGYNDIAAAGIMGNIEQESHYSTTAGSKDSRGPYGLCQWMNGRLSGEGSGLYDFAKNHNASEDDAGTQLAFLQYELQINASYYAKSLPDAMNACSSPSKAAVQWVRDFEGAEGQEEKERSNFAEEHYQNIQSGKYN